MQIPCPLCGPRDTTEFSCLGDATTKRPLVGDGENDAATVRAFHNYTYLRENPAGWHQELWYHEMGCRSWLTVTRNTLTHEIKDAVRTQDSRSGETP